MQKYCLPRIKLNSGDAYICRLTDNKDPRIDIG